MHKEVVQYCYYNSPVGILLLAGLHDILYLLRFPSHSTQHSPDPAWLHNEQAFTEHKTQLTEYFARRRTAFNLTYALTGSQFQKSVLAAVADIPYGDTASYSTIATRINNPHAVRAVGGANATNPLPIIIPCHRVIGKNGTLTGFGGGIAVKAFLLQLESASFNTL